MATEEVAMEEVATEVATEEVAMEVATEVAVSVVAATEVVRHARRISATALNLPPPSASCLLSRPRVPQL